MKKSLLSILVCPICQSELSLEVFETNKKAEDLGKGLLICNQEHVFPIINSIPRMLPEALKNNNDIFEKDFSKMSHNHQKAVSRQISVKDENFRKKYSSTQKSFTSEWQSINPTDIAWGQDIPYRKQLFLDSFDAQPANVKGKLVLDAGCGHGETVLALSQLDNELVAMDLSYSIDHVKGILDAKRDLNSTIHLVQGNVAAHPFKDGVFDIVYSAGVLHHTPNTKHSFAKLSSAVKQGGSCFIEVYSNDHKNLFEMVVYHLFNAFRQITLRLPLPILHGVCWAGAPFLWLYVNLFGLLKGRDRYIDRTLREMKLSLFDALSPPYDWHHPTEEVIEWFKELGFVDLQKTYQNHIGIGILGVKEESK